MLLTLAFQRTRNVSPRVFAVILLFLQCVSPAYAKGKGPVGIWLASDRYALVADTSLPGLVLVDLEKGIAVERLKMANVRPVGIAACPSCKFAIVSGGKSDSGLRANVWRLNFKDTISNLLAADGKLGLSDAQLEALDVRPDGRKLDDGRMCLVSDDGKTAFIASLVDQKLVRVELEPSLAAKTILHGKGVKPFGLNWDRNGHMLVTMHKQEIWRMTADGEVLAVYDTRSARCPGARELKPNLRAAVDDPVNPNSLLVLASQPRHYDAVVWRLSIDGQGRQTCESVASKIGVEPGWVDASGEAIEFSRPHFLVLRGDRTPPQLVITDIDNRALRLLDLTDYSSTSVMYDRDRLLEAMPHEKRWSETSCAQLSWTGLDSSGDVASCIRQAPADALDMTLVQAGQYCRVDGARLCEPAELLSAGFAHEIAAWTAAECASCWQRSERESCIIHEQDYKSPDIFHSHKEFSQSWRSGQALVIASGGGASTVCRPIDEKAKAAAHCCADVLPTEEHDDA